MTCGSVVVVAGSEPAASSSGAKQRRERQSCGMFDLEALSVGVRWRPSLVTVIVTRRHPPVLRRPPEGLFAKLTWSDRRGT